MKLPASRLRRPHVCITGVSFLQLGKYLPSQKQQAARQPPLLSRDTALSTMQKCRARLITNPRHRQHGAATEAPSAHFNQLCQGALCESNRWRRKRTTPMQCMEVVLLVIFTLILIQRWFWVQVGWFGRDGSQQFCWALSATTGSPSYLRHDRGHWVGDAQCRRWVPRRRASR